MRYESAEMQNWRNACDWSDQFYVRSADFYPQVYFFSGSADARARVCVCINMLVKANLLYY